MKTSSPLSSRPLRPHSCVLSSLCLAALALTGCAGGPGSVVQGPLHVPPQPVPDYIERVSNGAIYQPGMTSVALFSAVRRPQRVGDTLKIDISEKLSASTKLATDTSRSNSVASKGPGGSGSGIGVVDKLLNLDASASGSDAFKGSGNTSKASEFQGQLAAAVVNVLPNGHLVVAGERAIALNGSNSTLRFSGVVDPRDIKAGNVVASADVVNARFEVGGEGDVPRAGQRTWLQRVLTDGLTVW